MKEKKIIDAGSGICPLGPSRKVKAAIRKAARGISERPDAAVAMLERFFSSKFGLERGRMVFANSIGELLHLITFALRPKKVLVCGPSVSIYGEASAAAGAEVLHIAAGEESGFTVDIERLGEGLKGVDLLFIGNPGRLTGRVINAAVFSRITDLAARSGTRVVVDESLMEFTGQDVIGDARPEIADSITLRSTANFYGLAGLELAYAVSQEPIVRELRMKRYCSLNILSVEAARAAMKDRTYRKLARSFVEDEKKLISLALRKVQGASYIGSDSNVFLIKLDHPDEKILAYLLRGGFAVTDCGGIEGLGQSFLRMSVMAHERNVKFIRLLKAALAHAVSKPQ